MFAFVLLFMAAEAATPNAAATADPPPFTAATCDDPAKRKALLATDPDKLDVLQRLKAKSDANQAKMEQLIDRLAERAKWTPEQKSEFGMKLLEAPGFDAAMKEGFHLFGGMMKQLDIVLKSKDAQTNCHAVVAMMAIVPKIDVNAQHQWDLMRGVVEDEAKRLGVSLD
jgi:hypothetical protein